MSTANLRSPEAVREAGWLAEIAYPPEVELPGRVRRVGRTWYLEQFDGNLWTVLFEPEEHRTGIAAFEACQKAAQESGFSEMTDQYRGELKNGVIWRLQRIGANEPLRCWLKRNVDRERIHELGESMGKALRKFQDGSPAVKKSMDWADAMQTDIDYLFYCHGLLPCKNRNEYILIDFINENRHLLRAMREKNVAFSMSPDSLHIAGDGGFALDDWSWVTRGDGIYDLVFLNDIAPISPAFCKAFLEGYANGKPTRAMFRNLALYTAIYTLKRLVDVAGGEVRYDDINESNCHFQRIISSFQFFDDVVPEWAK